MKPIALPLLVALAGPVPAGAQQLTLTMSGGRVSLEATGVPVRQILAEWSRVGDVQIVNGDKVQGPALTLSLQNVPERDAIDTVLRGVSGYMVAARAEGTGAPHASRYDRILILPTSSPVAPAPPPSAASRYTPPPEEPADFGMPQDPAAIDDFSDLTAPGAGAQDPAALEALRDAMRRRFGTVGASPQAVAPGVRGLTFPPQNRAPAQNAMENVPSAQPTARNPFGLPVGSGAAGTITPVPGSAQPGQFPLPAGFIPVPDDQAPEN